MTVSQMRSVISRVYDTSSWRAKVEHMSDDQVIAIYYSFAEKGKLEKARPKSKPRYVQMSFNDILEEEMRYE